MANSFKRKMKGIGRYIWELFKSSMLPSFMYCCAGWLLMVIILSGEPTWTSSKLIWSVVCIAGGAGYQVFTAWACGGGQYEMLASGNVKRANYYETGNEYVISGHKVSKEYRVWKGFVIGALTSVLPIVVALLLGFNQEAVHAEKMSKGMGFLTLVGFFLCPWSMVPFYCANAAGKTVSYFYSLIVCAIPILVGGVMYIVGAYVRRNKNYRLRILEEKRAAEEAARKGSPKVNYGGLPGTKPKKRR